MANKKEVVRSVEAQKVIDVLKNHKGEALTLAEISQEAGMELMTGHLSSGRSAGLIKSVGEKEITETVSVKKTVKTYQYIGE